MSDKTEPVPEDIKQHTCEYVGQRATTTQRDGFAHDHFACMVQEKEQSSNALVEKQ